MRISEWSSDVCSSDLTVRLQVVAHTAAVTTTTRTRDETRPSSPCGRGVAAGGLRPGRRQRDVARPGATGRADHAGRHDARADAPAGRRHHDATAHRRHPSAGHHDRSEEHTSELHSLMRIPYAVFCLNKKQNTIEHRKNHIIY